MKKFVELIQRIHQERFSVVMNKIVSEKIPVAFLSVAPVENAVEMVKNLRAQSLNITNLITITPPPPDYFQIDFDITSLSDVGKIHPRPEYILTLGIIDSRMAIKYISDCKVIDLGGPGRNSEMAYDAFMNHLTDLKQVYESLIDEKSRETFYGYWLGNISHQYKEILFTDTAHYLATGFIPKKGDIFIDVGVCDGGTSIKFSNLGCKVYGFEMDKENFKLAKEVAEKNNFVVENVGLGSFEHSVKYTHSGAASRITDDGNESAKIIKLDQYIEEKKLPSVDFIKLDVEGAELDVLRGAAAIISRFKPIIAVSAYHKWDDFWTLMNFVKSIRPDYEWALRQYPESKEDIPTWFTDNKEEIYNALGLEPDIRGWEECVLLAR